jgi:hypothetical protein
MTSNDKVGALGKNTRIAAILESALQKALSDPRCRRYWLRDQAATILSGSTNPNGGQWRTIGCLQKKVGAVVTIRRGEVDGNMSAAFGSVMVCGSVWSCPICASRISEYRRKELSGAIEFWRDQGKEVYGGCFTFAHNVFEPCKQVLDSFRGSLRCLKSYRGYKEAVADLGVVHTVTALEVTYGANGWHVHGHILYFVSGSRELSQLEDFEHRVKINWARVCSDRERRATYDNGFRLLYDDIVSGYVVKSGNDWGLAEEMTKAVSKSGRAGNRNPFGLLADFGVARGKVEAARLFTEYSSAFFGKHQLQWSRGAKQALGVIDKSDQEAASDQAGLVDWAYLVDEVWRAICKHKLQPDVLAFAEEGDIDGLHEFLAEFGIYEGVGLWEDYESDAELCVVGCDNI